MRRSGNVSEAMICVGSYLILRDCVPERDKIVHSGEHRRRISQFLRDEEAENKGI